MITPKSVPPTKREETEAYEQATLRDEGKCVRCGSNEGVQRDHRRNRSQGGETAIWQLQLLCAICHHWATTHPALAVRDGFAVPMSQHHPSLYPARRLVFGTLRWCIYSGSGFALLTDVQAAVIREGLGV